MSSHEPPRRRSMPRGFSPGARALRADEPAARRLPAAALWTLAGGGDVASQLQAIKIEPIGDRLGHYLENELIFGLNGTGAPVDPKYSLKITLTENVQSPLIDTVTGYPTSGTVVVTATYTLTPSGAAIRSPRGPRRWSRAMTATRSASPISAPRATPRSATRGCSPSRSRPISPPLSPQRDRMRFRKGGSDRRALKGRKDWSQSKTHEADKFLARPAPHIYLYLVFGPDLGLVAERARAIVRDADRRSEGPVPAPADQRGRSRRRPAAPRR